MKPAVGSGFIPALRRAHDSRMVNGQGSLSVTTAIPQPTAGTCSAMVRGQRNARKPPLGT
ncbi:hypothetical protein AN931_16180 [Mycobacterium intracellulare subsp. chimaera]|uniref:Uncharacterized protein n=1 Tax=Mycobacterium indicus pranii (strain DSM 45239 / MTCC 9506) TaxID=1232724 RepID=J9WKF1_MYCIP|nr:Hypothetical protein MIP_05624 [Mycobacterium intracellulare subsp. intracellulare MTCC 9506]AOS93165.1 hypothetical protein AN480_19625 [Mycobacterium intracellulare subsp. chimaera]ETZ33535.1 hypothetical protein L843_4023 [Mycobacterium intracellulare MIN_061107_1834]KPN49332.1 hypothetical protein AN932_15410 [Mycobacterium intracellulare subsp. chimaera]KPN54173.1 hypothetical protein AN931_16180 [Mycobacterium intracellulare subsp. chimaera]